MTRPVRTTGRTTGRTLGRTLTRTGRFLRDEAGSILVLWILSLVAVIAFVALVFDMGRVQVTHGELQSFADSVALAAAGELDGRADAIARATAAAAEVADSNVYGGDGTLQGAGDYTLTFLSGLPGADGDAITSSEILEPDGSGEYTAADDAAARLVRVNVAESDFFDLGFLAATRALLGAGTTASANVAVEAIAGFTMEACDITPLMFCAPSATWKADANKGTNILLRTGGNSAGWFPGAFGFLELPANAVGSACQGIPENNMPKLIACILGADQNRTQCYSQESVNVKPGESSGLYNDVFNIRFGRFPDKLKDYKGNSNFSVAPNIISGEAVNCKNWKVTESTNSVGLPSDTCFGDEDLGIANTCNVETGGLGDRFGDGEWDYDTYIDMNYGNGDGVLQSGEDPIASHLGSVPAEWQDMRYGLYRAEIEYAKSIHGGNLGPILSGRDETGYAQCGGTVTSNPERRVVIAASIDCSAITSANGKDDLPVIEFVEVFMLRPVGASSGTPAGFDISVEVLGSAGESGYGSAGAGGIFRDVVQLYR